MVVVGKRGTGELLVGGFQGEAARGTYPFPGVPRPARPSSRGLRDGVALVPDRGRTDAMDACRLSPRLLEDFALARGVRNEINQADCTVLQSHKGGAPVRRQGRG